MCLQENIIQKSEGSGQSSFPSHQAALSSAGKVYSFLGSQDPYWVITMRIWRQLWGEEGRQNDHSCQLSSTEEGPFHFLTAVHCFSWWLVHVGPVSLGMKFLSQDMKGLLWGNCAVLVMNIAQYFPNCFFHLCPEALKKIMAIYGYSQVFFCILSTMGFYFFLGTTDRYQFLGPARDILARTCGNLSLPWCFLFTQ